MSAPAWRELRRVPAAGGTSARDAVSWFLLEEFGREHRWEWVEAQAGTFKVDGLPNTYRIRLGGAYRDEWLFEVRGKQQ